MKTALLVFLFLFLAAEVIRAERPNILIILADDAGYNDFGFMGSPDLDTPELDRLARAGTVFLDAHVTSTVCSPSRAGLITGRYQQRFGHECNVPPDDQGMNPAETTLGDALGNAGYRTGLVGKWHLGNRAIYHPNLRGFDYFYGVLEGSRSYFPDPGVDRPYHYRAILENREQVDFEGYLTDVFTDKAIGFIQADSNAPWFLFLSYTAPHTPMQAKDVDMKRYEGHPRQTLAAMTWSMDENVGRLVDLLEERGELADTLIFFLSDNGGAGEHNNQSSNAPLKGWKGNKYEGGHRVPFFVTWPQRLRGGSTFQGLTSAMDIFPTALAAAGIEQTPGRTLDGVNLLPYLDGGAIEDPHETLFWRKDRMAAMRRGEDKLIRLDGYGYRLYDLGEDLGESRDLSKAHPERLQSLIQALFAWEEEMGSPDWYEGEAWNRVTYEIHQALMENREPRYLSPSGIPD